MKTVLTAAQMKAADLMTIRDFGIPALTLMESAGRCAVDSILARFGDLTGAKVCCLSGRGNNGGDALVAARYLHERGAKLTVILTAGTDLLSDQTRINLRVLEKLQKNSDRLEIRSEANDLQAFDVIVDGMLGTGLSDPVREPLRSVVERVNASRKTVVALDIPTGIHSETGKVMGAAVRADLTVTMGAAKIGLFLNDGPDNAGRVEVVDIGIPRFVLHEAASLPPGPTSTPDRLDISARFPARDRRAHKYSAGLALVVAGSPGLSGAPVMAATAAARAGAGAVVCAIPDTVHSSVDSQLTEVMTLSLPSGERGISLTAASHAIKNRLERAAAVLVGPGLGRQEDTGHFVHQLLSSTAAPVVIDADALFHLVAVTKEIADRSRGKWILTPHIGELRRLAGKGVDLSNPVESARMLAQAWNCVLVFKGAPTVTASPDGHVYINPTGNQALATAGTGDVLAGMIVGFLAQGLTPIDAALCALYTGGETVARLSEKHNRDSLMAMDIVNALPTTLKNFAG